VEGESGKQKEEKEEKEVVVVVDREGKIETNPDLLTLPVKSS